MFEYAYIHQVNTVRFFIMAPKTHRERKHRRRVAAYTLRQYTNLSLNQIAFIVGFKSHSSVVLSYGKVSRLLIKEVNTNDTNKNTHNDVNTLKKQMKIDKIK